MGGGIHSFIQQTISLSAHQTCSIFSWNSPLLEVSKHVNRQREEGNRLVRQVPSSLGDLRASEKTQELVERAMNLEAENLGLSLGFITF